LEKLNITNYMTPSTSTPRAMLDDIKETLEKEKVKLTPEVEKYTRSHLRTIQDKLSDDEDITEGDLAFIKKVKMWIFMPEELREKYPDIENMEESDEVRDSEKRKLSLQQWLDLSHMAEADGKEKEWIDNTFKFNGGQIICDENLNFRCCKAIHTIPDGLIVGGDFDLFGTSLKTIPQGLSVGEYFDLGNCTSLTSLPDGLEFRKELDLRGCTSLGTLPGGLRIGGYLFLMGCTSLTSLPDDMEVEGTLHLSENLNEQVRQDARRLEQEGKIGKIEYRN